MSKLLKFKLDKKPVGLKTAVSFFRVSSKRQEDGFSLTAQQKLASNYIKDSRFKVIKSWSVSESASKEKSRTHFYEMLEFVRQNNIKHIVFDKIDRACRGYRSAYLVEELISEYGVCFHFVRDHLVIDSSSPMSDRDRFGIGVWMGKRYSENLRMEIIKGMDERRSQGFWNHKAPVGYVNIRQGKSAKIEVNEKLAPFIKQVFKMYATGNYSQNDLFRYLKKQLPKEKLSTRVIENILSNPFYYGGMKFKEETVQGKHKAIIKKDLWDNCQRIRGIRAKQVTRNQIKANILKPLMGLLKCGDCNSMVTGETKIKPSGKRYTYYHCASKKCSQRRKSTREEVLLTQVIDSFKPFRKITTEVTDRLVQRLKEQTPEMDLAITTQAQELLEKQKELKLKIKSLEKLKTQGVLEKEDLEELITIKKNNLAKTEEVFSKILTKKGSFFSETKRVIELLKKLSDFMELSDNKLNKIRLAKIVLSNPVLKAGSIRYSYRNLFDNLLQIEGGQVWWR